MGAVQLYFGSNIILLVLDQLPQFHLVGLADHSFLDGGHIGGHFLEVLVPGKLLLVGLVVENMAILLNVVVQGGGKTGSLQVL